MIAYNKTWLTNQLLIGIAEKQYRSGTITFEEFNRIKEKFPVGFHSHAIFMRIGVFILTCIVSSCSGGLFGLLFADAFGTGCVYVLAIANYIVLEIFVQQKHHFRSGVDDALLWISAALLASLCFLWDLPENSISYMIYSAYISVITIVLSLRFADRIMSTVAYFSVLAFVFFTWKNLVPFGTATLPFMLILFSGLTNLLFQRFSDHPKTVHYTNCLLFLKVASLLSLYFAGNYYVVNELSNMMHGTSNLPGSTIQMGWFFWIWTFLIPAAYTWLGIAKKKSMLIRLGLLLTTVAGLTLHAYYSIMPVEWLLISCGILSLSISYFLTKYLETPKYGFTYQESEDADDIAQLQIESIIISESLSSTSAPPKDTGTTFGGGQFGGGGSSSEF